MTLPSDSNRRDFLAGSMTLGAMGFGAAIGMPAAMADDDRGDDFRVGVMNLQVYSHMGIWAPILKPFIGMRITHCWDIDPNISEGFAKGYNATAVKNFDDMLGKVDVIISGGYYNNPWNHIIHEPYLEAGLPNLINRPFANSVAKGDKMIEMARKYGAPILVPSSFEHTHPVVQAKAWAKEKQITCYNATNASDDYSTHGVHGVYVICRAIAEAGNPVISVAQQAKNWHSSPAVVTYEHQAPDGRSFMGTLHLGSFGLGGIRIHAQEEMGGKGFQIELGTGYPYNKTHLWAPTLWEFASLARGNPPSQSLEQIEHKHKVYMAGFWSILENEGKPTRLDQVPADWEAPVDLPNVKHKDTVLFRKKFG
ncbi:MAG: hypothetical protein MK102_08510 [Fuerstiella sp.]|nr:hypothetical protein [Fuerstiella sp.]